jgi:arabinogalactan oligomer/maltooligosaccharide transport system permease protein
MLTQQTRIRQAKKRYTRYRVQWSAYGYLSPALVTIAVLSVIPTLLTFAVAFTNASAIHFTNPSFVGLKNFAALFNMNDPLAQVFIPTFIWTVVFAFVTTALNYFVGLFLAVLLNNKNMRETRLYRAILIIPWAVPALISTLIWQGLLNQSYGQVNAVLHLAGIPAIPWLVNPLWARVSIILVNLWLSFPFMMTVCLGGLQAIPGEWYEAASIDGATFWQRFRYITLPSIWKISLPLVIPSFAFQFNNFNAVYLLTGGGPARNSTQFAGYTDILASAAYKMTLDFNRYDLAATIAVVLFILVGFFSWINMRATGAFREAD